MQIEAPGKRIKYLRETMGLNQVDLAQQVGMNRSSLSKVELGQYEPSMAQLAALAAALQTNVHMLVTGEEITPPEPDAFMTDEANEVGILLDGMDKNLREIVLNLTRQLAQENVDRRTLEKEYSDLLDGIFSRLESRDQAKARSILGKIRAKAGQ